MKVINVPYTGEVRNRTFTDYIELEAYLGTFKTDIVVLNDDGKADYLIFKDESGVLFMYGLHSGGLEDYFDFSDVADRLVDCYKYEHNFKKADVRLTYSFES